MFYYNNKEIEIEKTVQKQIEKDPIVHKNYNKICTYNGYTYYKFNL